MTNVAAIVHAQLRILGMPGLRDDEIQSSSLLVDDLGLDSMKFVDLTVALEKALGIGVFPMQDWVDERIRYGEPLSVGALVTACTNAVCEAER